MEKSWFYYASIHRMKLFQYFCRIQMFSLSCQMALFVSIVNALHISDANSFNLTTFSSIEISILCSTLYSIFFPFLGAGFVFISKFIFEGSMGSFFTLALACHGGEPTPVKNMMPLSKSVK